MTEEEIVPLSEKTFFDADAYPGRERRVLWIEVLKTLDDLKKDVKSYEALHPLMVKEMFKLIQKRFGK